MYYANAAALQELYSQSFATEQIYRITELFISTMLQGRESVLH